MRYDFLIIWGHGLEYKEEIINSLAANSAFEIIKVIQHKVTDIESFVRSVYSCDYAPFEHLKAKTLYLLDKPAEVLIVFFKNYDPQEDFRGEGEFRHVESKTLRDFKQTIRDKFNPQINGVRSEEHVIHTSDNEAQVEFMLRFLGYNQGIQHLQSGGNIIFPFPYHLPQFHKATIKLVDFDKLFCNFFKKNGTSIEKVHGLVQESPHYQFLLGKQSQYQEYLEQFWGKELTDYYSSTKFEDLSNKFSYLEPPYQMHYVVVTYDDNMKHYTIVDGLHRASIALFQGYSSIIVCLI